MSMPRFPLGRLVATPGALAAFERTGDIPAEYVARHLSLDPGLLDAHDQVANLRAVHIGARIISSYALRDGTVVWLITEADRSVTTILLPEEY